MHQIDNLCIVELAHILNVTQYFKIYVYVCRIRVLFGHVIDKEIKHTFSCNLRSGENNVISNRKAEALAEGLIFEASFFIS